MFGAPIAQTASGTVGSRTIYLPNVALVSLAAWLIVLLSSYCSSYLIVTLPTICRSAVDANEVLVFICHAGIARFSFSVVFDRHKSWSTAVTTG